MRRDRSSPSPLWLVVLVLAVFMAVLAARDPVQRDAGALPRGEVFERSLPGRPELAWLAFVPRSAGPEAPLLVLVHGNSRDTAGLLRAFVPHARGSGVVLVAPIFDERHFADYQRLGRYGHGARADLALERLVTELAREAPIASQRLFLLGHSGGAQFVHRFLMAHPERVAAAVASSAGWYTFPDPARAYPYGLAEAGELQGIRFAPDLFLRVPVLVRVGARDLSRNASLRRERDLDRAQGRTRVERSTRWAEAMNRAARERELPPPVTLEVVPGVGHRLGEQLEPGGLASRAFRFLFSAPRARP